jgi:hypothetical protein
VIVSEGLWDDLAQVLDPDQPRERLRFHQQLDQLWERYPRMELLNVSGWVLQGIVRQRVGKLLPTDMEIEQLINEVIQGMAPWIAGITRGRLQRAIRIAVGYFMEAVGAPDGDMTMCTILAAIVLLERHPSDWLDLLNKTRNDVETVSPDTSADQPADMAQLLRKCGVEDPQEFMRQHGIPQP